MTRTMPIWAVGVCLSVWALVGTAGLARAEVTEIPPAEPKAAERELENSGNGEAHPLSLLDRVRYAQATEEDSDTQEDLNAQLELAGEKKWKFSVGNYLWMTGLDGDGRIEGVDMEVDTDFGDILDNLDFAISLHIEAQRGRWGLFFDPTYLKSSSDGKVGSTSVDVDTDFWQIEIGAFVRAFERDLGSSGRFHLTTDALSGLRWTYISGEVDFSGPPPPSDLDDSKDWLDLFVGWRTYLTLAPKWSVKTRTDFGGFGIGSSSDFAWNSLILFGYQMTEKLRLYFGYRSLDMDYDGGSSFKYDVTTSGPIIGTEFRF